MTEPNVKISREIHAKLKQVCKAEGMKVSAFAERAIEKEISRISVVKKIKSGLKK